MPVDERERLAALRRYDLLDTPAEPPFDRITRMAARVLDMPLALITTIDEDRQWYKSCFGLERGQTAREDAICAHAILSDEVMVVPDTTLDPRFVHNPSVTGPPNVRFYAGAPLITHDGYRLGTLCVIDRVPRTLTPGELETLVDLAATVVDELELRSSAGRIAEAREEARRANETLEQRIAQRTAELSRSLERAERLDAQRSELLAQLVVAQEDERKLIAGGIHDGAVQQMVVVTMRLEMLRKTNPTINGREFDEVLASVRNALGSLRNLMFDLRPYALDSDGLSAALEELVRQTSKLPGVPEIGLIDLLETEPPEATRIILYRVAQEALTNARKHARASHIEILLEDHDGGHAVRITDDGDGFEVGDGTSAPGHLGLTSMRERTELAGGRLDVTSVLREGTTVACWLPGDSTDGDVA